MDRNRFAVATVTLGACTVSSGGSQATKHEHVVLLNVSTGPMSSVARKYLCVTELMSLSLTPAFLFRRGRLWVRQGRIPHVRRAALLYKGELIWRYVDVLLTRALVQYQRASASGCES